MYQEKSDNPGLRKGHLGPSGQKVKDCLEQRHSLKTGVVSFQQILLKKNFVEKLLLLLLCAFATKGLRNGCCFFLELYLPE
jgi:hypothetical protein